MEKVVRMTVFAFTTLLFSYMIVLNISVYPLLTQVDIEAAQLIIARK